MVLFNYSVTLDYFNLITIPSNYLYRYILPISIASIFIFMSGVTSYISYEKHKEKLTRKYFIRGIKLLFFAALITSIQLCFCTPIYDIFRHTAFLRCSSFLIPFFIKYNKLNLVAGLSIILSGVYLQQQTFQLFISISGLVLSRKTFPHSIIFRSDTMVWCHFTWYLLREIHC